jgi:Raf kinase inhibitor-like YbhB/YbcL family protein
MYPYTDSCPRLSDRLGLLAAFVLCNWACNGCRAGGAQPAPPPGVALGSLTVTSSSFPSNGAIPVDYTCDGTDKSPELTFSAPPPGTQSFAIVADDPDAPGGTFTHWIAFNVGGDVRTIAEGADISSLGGAVGTNDFNRAGYAGPCPPKGELHRYSFRVFALDASIDTKRDLTRAGMDAAMSGHVLAEGALVGVFSR